MSNFRGRGGGQRRPWRRRENNWSVRPNNDDELPPEEFTTLSIFPTREDMDPEQATFLRANKVAGRFRDTAHYLDVQFRLLREDYIRPLRNGIQEYRQMKDSGEHVGRIQDLRLYQNVKIVDMTCSKGGLEHFVQFELTRELQKVRWQSSKRLIFGDLVCLSPDDFQTFYFAVVSDRQIKHLHKGIIQLHFENCLLEVLSLPTNTIFTMAESTAFFEAYRHVLEGMQEMQISQSLPFSRYLVDCTAAISPPQYLTTPSISQSYHRQSASTDRMDLSCLLKDDVYGGASSVAVLHANSWPRLNQTVLNQSQLDAIKLALTKEVAIIQGPPGTGKTFVGLKVAKILLENRGVWTDPNEGQRPILVVCYTNHALDQFLAGIQKFCPEGIVRVGSRCKDPEIEKYNLKNVRRRAKKRATRGERAKIGQIVRACKDTVFKRMSLIQLLQREVIEKSSQLAATAKGIAGVSALRQHISQDHYLGLVRGKNPAPAMMGYQSALRYKVAERDAMSKWLTNGQVEEEESEDDIYKAVAAEVTKKILEGETTTRMNPDLDPSQIHNITYGRRAKLYRAWVQKVTKAMPTNYASGAARFLLQDIPEDSRLQPFVPAYLYTAIVLPMTSQHHEQAARLTKAWLGVSNATPPEDVVKLVSQGDLLHESRVSTDEVATMSHKRRASLYRYWITTLREKLDALRCQRREPYQKYADFFKLMETSVLDDSRLQILNSPDFLRLFPAIQKEMTKRHARQSRFFIKSWLGVQDLCQSLQDLENVSIELEKTEDDEEDNRKLNVDEEAEILQNERHLDDDDDDDDDDEDDFEDNENHAGRHAAANSSTLEVAKAMQEMDIGLTFDASTPVLAAAAGGQAWHRVHDTQLVRKIRRLMTSSRPMTSAEMAKISGSRIWEDGFTVEERVRLYLYWLGQLQSELRAALRPVVEQYELASKTLKELRQLEDRKVLVEAEVIGMTTTGAARLRKVLAEVACPIIILEEAAEVLEAHVVTTLHSAAQHLILIGDHKQLRPSTAVYELRDFHLDLSLFERLVNNKLSHVTLTVQHRMRPEVARLVRHVYPMLEDAIATQNRSDICGMAHNVFLFHHEQEELRNSETCSRSNRHEAELCVRLCRYLLQQGYAADKVTILTAYSGQVFALNNALQQEEQNVQEVRVTSVDNFQGEENDIIILSLVRNNRDGVVGFLSTDNRVCVALSRARNGFYVFGNYKILAEKSDLWKKVFQTAKDHGQTGTKLTLKCVNHPDTLVEIMKAKDFEKAPEGGCLQACGKRLEKCGHMCKLRCHAYDRDHKEYQCQERCERASACKLPKEERHPCTRRCFQDCGKLCMTSVLKATPGCGHTAMMECHRDPSTWICKERCANKLGCGHQCSMECKDCRKALRPHSQPCIIMVDKPLPCGHAIKLACNVPASAGMCQKPCGAVLAGCGHVCKGVCGACRTAGKHKTCLEKVTKTLPCEHQVLATCSIAPAELPACQKPCQAKLPSCGHPCSGICGDCSKSGAHKACPVLVEKYGPCGHVIAAPCGAAGSSLPSCGKPCHGVLSCGHPCKGVCGSCTSQGHHESCKEQVRKTLPCGHSVQGECGAQPGCLLPCEEILKCRHACKGICGECRTNGHMKCLEKVQKKFADCRHPVTVECSATTAPSCEHKCNATMKCGHTCDGVCGKCKETGKHVYCKKLFNRFQLCGHRVEAECGAATLPICGDPCQAVLGCGHRCKGICGTCKKKGHSECQQKVERKYKDCSHLVKVECSSPNLPKCGSPCGVTLSCGHACTRVCNFCKTVSDHAKCKEQVEKYYKSCQHPVTMECSATKVSPCQNACGTKLPCSHACTGVCSTCKTGGKHAACKKMVEKRRLCGHTVTVECGKAKLPTCGKPCAKPLECGHACKGICGVCKAGGHHEPCREMVDKIFLDCKHKLSAECSATTAGPCQKPCPKQLPCDHVCQGVCGQCRKSGKHQPCKTVVEKAQPLCGHSVAAACNATTLPACRKPCHATLKCSHKCQGTCGSCRQTGDHKKCQERVKRVFISCQHPVTLECGAALAPPCESICMSPLPCGHQCSGVCGSCQRRDKHPTCKVCDV